MTKNLNPREYYRDTIQQLNQALKPHRKRRKFLGWLRFLSIVAALGFAWYGIVAAQLWVLVPVIACIAVFTWAFNADASNNEIIRNLETLVTINSREIDYLDHRYLRFEGGSEYLPDHHPYAHDLDILGHASLYQFLNRAYSDPGKEKMAAWLLHAAEPSEILKRQESVRELSHKTKFRQQLQAHSLRQPVRKSTADRIGSWIMEANQFGSPAWQWLRVVVPILALTTLGLFLFDQVPDGVFYPLLLVFALFSFSISRKIMPVYAQLNRIAAEMESLSASTAEIEEQNFQSAWLTGIQSQFKKGEYRASKVIGQLKASLNRFDYRLNPIVFVPLNIFLCWDLQQILFLEKWKTVNRDRVSGWFDGLAHFEALGSLGTAGFNHPDWVYPQLNEEPGTFRSVDMGHPLIPSEKCVVNSFRTEGTGRINLITGSNMAGKSTFLRTVGINMVLGTTGSPVFATELEFYPATLISTMRVSDNLEESTSTFYAELKKLKEIIDSVYRGDPVFLLMDEILRGTNSADRHTGSRALIRQLVSHAGTGLLATHDLDLAAMEKELPGQIINYHFDVQVNQEELFFDYKLKTGICQSMNASILMKKIGIEL